MSIEQQQLACERDILAEDIERLALAWANQKFETCEASDIPRIAAAVIDAALCAAVLLWWSAESAGIAGKLDVEVMCDSLRVFAARKVVKQPLSKGEMN